VYYRFLKGVVGVAEKIMSNKSGVWTVSAFYGKL